MRILLITDEEWNDYVYGNGVLTNWFTGFDADFAQIYCSPGKPINNICDRYFQITDAQMFKSLFCKELAGGTIYKETDEELINKDKENAQRKGIYGVMKKISTLFHTPVLMLRDFIWSNGRFDSDSLKEFVDNFHPDIVFCPRMVTPKLMRLERIVSTMTEAPFVAFTGDNEASMEGISWSPLYWIRKSYIHCLFKKHISLYTHYLMHSKEQADEYTEKYGVSTSTFFKSGTFYDSIPSKCIGKPIRIVYAGRLYCNRWKSLAEIGKALQRVNKAEVKMILDIYTTEPLTGQQKKALTEDKFIYLRGSVSPSELVTIYRNADIALHVESMDKKNRQLTRVSFSTKIIDLMASTCAIMAICWNRQTGYQYLKDKDAAFCISDYKEILPQLEQICLEPSLIQKYAEKAYQCGKTYHSRDIIQGQLRCVFENIINRKR